VAISPLIDYSVSGLRARRATPLQDFTIWPTWQGLTFEPLSPGLESSALTTRPTRLTLLIGVYIWLRSHYYESTGLALVNLIPPSVCLTFGTAYQSQGPFSRINKYYTDIVTALHAAADNTVPRVQSNCCEPLAFFELTFAQSK
jgi:hypothetical protein